MRAQSPSHSRGLLAGLLALVVFASAAVAMVAQRPGTDTATGTQTAPAQADVLQDGDGRTGARLRGEGDGDRGGRDGFGELGRGGRGR
jgi:hypothetical protein